jgi:hypothetical protein
MLRRQFSVLRNSVVVINYTDSHTSVVYIHCCSFLFIFLTPMAEINRISLYLNQVSFVVRYRKIMSYTELV